MKIKLKRIAKVDLGYPFRARLEVVPNGNVAVVQMKDIDEQSRLDAGDLAPVYLPAVKDVHRVEKGDVLFRPRGRVNTATLVKEELGNVVAAAPLLRIRAKEGRVLSEYLAWYINQPQAQNYLTRQVAGTITKMINKKAVEDMEIELPPIKQQEQIVAIARLAEREQELLAQLAEKRKSYVNTILMQLAFNK